LRTTTAGLIEASSRHFYSAYCIEFVANAATSDIEVGMNSPVSTQRDTMGWFGVG
jgi:hypothetical protein